MYMYDMYYQYHGHASLMYAKHTHSIRLTVRRVDVGCMRTCTCTIESCERNGYAKIETNKIDTELVKHQQLTNKLCSTLSLAPNSCESCLTSLLHKARADMIDVYSRAVNHDVRDKTQSKLTDEEPAYYSC